MSDKLKMLGQIEYQICGLESKLSELNSIKERLIVEISNDNAVEASIKNTNETGETVTKT